MEKWQPRKLTQLADYINGYAFKATHWSKEGLPIIRIEQLKNPDGKYDYCNHRIPSANLIHRGDLIFSWSASLFLKIWDREVAALNQHLFKVVPYAATDKLFLKYVIEYHLVELTKTAHGSTIQHITRKELEKFEIKVPSSKSEQTRIAEILSIVDKAIASTEALIAKYSRIKTGLMQDLLTRGIDEEGNIRSKATHRFVVKNGLEVPEDWEVDELTRLIIAIDPQPDHRTPKELKDGIPYLGIGDVDSTGNFDFTKCRRVGYDILLEHQKRYKLNVGDIIFGKIGTIGEHKRLVVIENITLSANVILIQPKEKSDFVYWLLDSDLIHKQIKNSIHTTTQAAFGMGKIRSLIIPIPKTEEQTKIAKALNNVEDTIVETQRNLAKLKSIKLGLMQDLLSGNVRVPNHTKILETE